MQRSGCKIHIGVEKFGSCEMIPEVVHVSLCFRMAPEVIACDENPDATYDNRVSYVTLHCQPRRCHAHCHHCHSF